MTELILSPLRHLDVIGLNEAAKRETRRRELRLPPTSVYRWWARRTDAVNGRVLEAAAWDLGPRLVVADPFAGGGVIPLAALARGHRVYAQDLNPWAVAGMHTMLTLPSRDSLAEAATHLQGRTARLLDKAYGTATSTGEPAMVGTTVRVGSAVCGRCGRRRRLFPHATVSRCRRKEQRGAEAFLACKAGHLFRGRHDRASQACPQCSRRVDPGDNYTVDRQSSCPYCRFEENLSVLRRSAWMWEPVLVNRVWGARQRELDVITSAELLQADDAQWKPRKPLGAIPEGAETRTLRRHGFLRWEDLYPTRQRYVTERLLAALEADEDAPIEVRRALQMAIVGTGEMAGLASRWDRWYLKPYETMARHRFTFSTLVAEQNVWGAGGTGRGTLARRLSLLDRASEWLSNQGIHAEEIDGPHQSDCSQHCLARDARAWIVEGSSSRTLLRSGTVDLILTDPPFHDDIQYSELSLPLRSWLGLSTEPLVDEVIANSFHAGSNYEEQLHRVFAECRRILKPQGHLILSFANRQPTAWAALLRSLDRSGFRGCGYTAVHGENETDQAKQGVTHIQHNLLVDVVRRDAGGIRRWHSPWMPDNPEGLFLRLAGEAALNIGALRPGWDTALVKAMESTAFLRR
jgi:putative DNA methylase